MMKNFTDKKKTETKTGVKKREEKFPTELAELLKHPGEVAFFEQRNKRVHVFYASGGTSDYRVCMLRVKARLRAKSWVDGGASFVTNSRHVESSVMLGSRLEISFKVQKTIAYASKTAVRGYTPEQRKQLKIGEIS